MAINYSLIILCHTEITEITESSKQREQSQMHLNYVESRRTSLKANVFFLTQIAQITLILFIVPQKSQKSQKGFSDGIVFYKTSLFILLSE